MDKIKYFHELSKQEWETLKAEGLTWAEVAKRHPQPKWCRYPRAVDNLGCWSLIGFNVTGEDFCLTCECHKHTPGEKASQNTLRVAQSSRIRRLQKDPMLSYAEELSRLYFVLKDTIEKMDIALEGAEDHPVELTKEDALSVRAFLKEADVLIENAFNLFVNFSEQ